MTDEGKTEGKADTVTVETLQAELAEKTKKLMKYEEDLAYSRRENEKLKTVKVDRDKMVEDKANAGDPEAAKKLREEIRSELIGEIEKERNEKIKLQNELKQERVVKSGLAAAAEVFNSDALEFIESKISKFCDYEDGETIVKDDKGQVRYSKSNPREKMKVTEFVRELAENYPTFAKATAQSGTQTAGTKTNGTGARAMTLEQYNRLTPEQQKQISPEDAAALLKQISFR